VHSHAKKENVNSLFDTAPEFDQPLAVLKHCHDRIRKQNATLGKLVPHLQEHGADQQAQKAALGILRYFQMAAPKHHEDEEVDLLPTLQQVAKAEDAVLLQDLLPKILQQHELMAMMWAQLEVELTSISNGSAANLNAELVTQFQALYVEHMQIEETQIAPMAKRLFSEEQMLSLGNAMKHRRGVE
jgi:hemerythrin-like domain-containing protein